MNIATQALTPQQVCDRLNLLLEVDRGAVQAMMNVRVPACYELARQRITHIGSCNWPDDVGSSHSVTPLGLINALFGLDSSYEHAIGFEKSEPCGRDIVRFFVRSNYQPLPEPVTTWHLAFITGSGSYRCFTMATRPARVLLEHANTVVAARNGSRESLGQAFWKDRQGLMQTAVITPESEVLAWLAATASAGHHD